MNQELIVLAITFIIAIFAVLCFIMDRIEKFVNQKDKYEFYLFSGNQTMVDRDVKKMQEDGWELAGNITPFIGSNHYNGMLVPLKRKLT